MKIAIIYTTVGGTTKDCASLLAKELKNQTVELFEMGNDEPDFAEYDAVVVGFPIIMGRAHKIARRFLRLRADDLKKTKAAYYICCGFVDCFEEYAERCVPKHLRASAIDTTCLGGSLDPNRFKGLNRFIVKAVRNEILGGGDNADQRTDMVLPTIMEENISQLADKIRKS